MMRPDMVHSQIPQAFKTLLVVWFAHVETTETRGQTGEKNLYFKAPATRKAWDAARSDTSLSDDAFKRKYKVSKAEMGVVSDDAFKRKYGVSKEEILKYHPRSSLTAARTARPLAPPDSALPATLKPETLTPQPQLHDRSRRGCLVGSGRAAHIVFRILSTIVVIAELFSTGFLLYVGVRYIFWSGYNSLNPNLFEDGRFGEWGVDDDGNPDPDFSLPWMSETGGVEEVLMATLALQFVMDIDDIMFKNLLPLCTPPWPS
eukprot:2429629-Rhodomonas_salina.3